jgi:hypothetical protein
MTIHWVAGFAIQGCEFKEKFGDHDKATSGSLSPHRNFSSSPHQFSNGETTKSCQTIEFWFWIHDQKFLALSRTERTCLISKDILG